MAQGAAGMLLSGPWNFPVWKAQNPTFKSGVSRLPGPAAGFINYPVGGSCARTASGPLGPPSRRHHHTRGTMRRVAAVAR